jgi:hypothetical protein
MISHTMVASTMTPENMYAKRRYRMKGMLESTNSWNMDVLV